MAKGMTIGVLGDQVTDPRNAKALLADWVGDKPVTLIFAVTEDHFSETAQAIAELAGDEEWPYEIVKDSTTKHLKEFRAFVDGATAMHQSSAPITTLIKVLAKKPAPRLVLAWDGEKESVLSEEALEAAGEAEIPAFSLIKGLEPLSFDDSDEDEDEEEDEDETDVDDDVEDESESEEDEEESDDEEEEEGNSEDEEEEDVEDDETDSDEDEEEVEDEDEDSDEEDTDEDSEEDEDETEDEEEDSEEEDDAEDEDEDLEDDDDDSESDSEDEEIEDDDEEEDEESEEDEDVPTRSTGKTRNKKFTRDQLDALENEKLYALAKPYRILPGRGRGRSTIINELLAATGSEDAAPPAKKAPAKKAPARKTTAAKKTASTKSTAAKRPAAKKITATRTASTKATATRAPAKKTTTTRTAPARTASTSSGAVVGRREVKALVKMLDTVAAAMDKAAVILAATVEE